MRKGSAEAVVRRNITLPKSFAVRLEELKAKRGAASDSEILRQAINLLDAVTDPNTTVLLRDKETGREKEIVVT